MKKFLSVLKFKNNKKSGKTGENKRRKHTETTNIYNKTKNQTKKQAQKKST